MRRLAVAAALLGVALVALVLATAGGNDDAAPLRDQPLSAEALADSVGLNVHLGYADTAYADHEAVLNSLEELGVRHFRDAAAHDNPVLVNGLRKAAARGLRGTLIADPARDAAQQVAESRELMGGRLEAMEGPNELDDGRRPDWVAALNDFMPRLRSALAEQAPGVPLLGPSFIDPGNRMDVPADLPGRYNAHPYAGSDPPEQSLDVALREWAARFRDRAAEFTEAGYHNALAAEAYHTPVSEEVAAIYLPRLLVTAFAGGARRTFLYELIDGKPDPGLADPQQHFGLLRNDLTPKPAFAALAALLRGLRSSPGAPASELPELAISPGREAGVQHVVLRRRDGSRVLALWRTVSVWDREARRQTDPGQLTARIVARGRPVRDVEVWRPSRSGSPVERRPGAERLELPLEGDLVLVSLR